MKLIDAIQLAFESVRLYRFRSLLSILGVAIGVAAVISGVSLGLGNRESIMQKMAMSGADMMFFYQKGESHKFPQLEELTYKPELSITKEDIEFIKNQCKTVKEISPYLLMPVTLLHEGKYYTAKALGVLYPNEAAKISGIKIIEGRALTDLDVAAKARVCVIEKTNFADEIFGKQGLLGKEILLGSMKYEIVGVSSKLYFPYGYPERLIAIMPSSTLQDMIGLNKYTEVEIRGTNIKDIINTREQIRQILIRRFGYPSKLYISEYSTYVKTALETLNLLTFIIVGVAIISLTVGGVGIMNVMMTSVVERTREIGIAKAVGAKKSSILLLFLVESNILTFTGGIIGVILGLGASKLVTSMIGLPFLTSFGIILFGFSLSLVVGIVSGSYPAKRAADLDPVVALRQF